MFRFSLGLVSRRGPICKYSKVPATALDVVGREIKAGLEMKVKQ